MTERQVQLICDFEPDIIAATPSYLLVIADEFERQGIDPRRDEPAARALRRGAMVARRCARRSSGGSGVRAYRQLWPVGDDRPRRRAGMRRTRDGLTVWEDHFLPEIIDPETGRALADGEPGELVLTTLTKEAHADHPLPHARPDAAAARRTARSMRRHRARAWGAATTCSSSAASMSFPRRSRRC